MSGNDQYGSTPGHTDPVPGFPAPQGTGPSVPEQSDQERAADEKIVPAQPDPHVVPGFPG